MKARQLLRQTLVFIFLVVVLILFVFPFVLLLINSFKSNNQIIGSPLSLPTSYDFTNFIIAMDDMNYFGSFMNTSIITFVSVFLISLFSAMTAHYFVRNRTKFNNTLFFLMVSAMIIPFQAIMIPLVSIYGQKLGWIQAMPKLTLIFMYIGFGISLAVFIYHGFIKSIPLELEEAALVDGCNRRQTFFSIVWPILTPTSVTIGILNVLWIWNDYLLPVIILQNSGKENLTLPLAIQVFNGTYSADYEKFLPAVVMVIVPVLIIYLFVQRLIIQGITQGAVK